MALYESVFIARQDIAASQVDALIERFEGVVTAKLRKRKTGDCVLWLTA